MCQEKGAVVRGGASQRSGNPNTHNQKIENRATEGYSRATCSVTSDGRATGSKDDGGKLEWPWRKDRIYEAERVGHGIPIQCPGCLGNAGCPVVLTAWAGQRLAREEAADKDRSPRSFRKTLPGSTGRRKGGKGTGAFAVGNTLRWPPRCPPGPGVSALYDLLLPSMGRTVNTLG